MYRIVLFASITLALAVPASASARKHHHHRGCDSTACDKRQEAKWRKKHERDRRRHRHQFIGPVVASWYQDAGATASGRHYTYGVAHKTLPFGQRVRMCARHCITVRVDDRGPFIAGREFDLNPASKYALGCGDLCNVRYRLIR